jgi:predicted membrane protein
MRVAQMLTNQNISRLWAVATTMAHYVGNCMKAMIWKTIRIAVATVIASLLVYCLPGF